MSTLSKDQLLARLNSDNDGLIITPILDYDRQLNQIGVDCRLGNQFIIFKTQNFQSIDINLFGKNDSTINNLQEEIVIPFKHSFILHPQTMVLGSTLEYICIPSDIEASIEGRSSWARYGLIIATAVTIDPGFKGCITLELANISNMPIQLYPGMRIAQLVCREASEKNVYSDKKYIFPIGPEISKLHLDPDIEFFVK